MKVPSYLLPHRALHYAKLADTGLGPVWDIEGVPMRCKVVPKHRRVERERESAGTTRTVVDGAQIQTDYSQLAVNDRVVWADRTLVVTEVSGVPDPWGHIAWWDIKLGEKP